MQFRYKLDKKTFKNKKIPAKKAPGEENISADQRGNETWTDSDLLSLDKDSKRQPETDPRSKEVSRRALFSFGRLSDFADAVEEEEKKTPGKQGKTEEDGDENLPVEHSAGENPVEAPPLETEPEAQETIEPEKKSGFFKRMASKFKRNKPDSAETGASPEDSGSPDDATPAQPANQIEAGERLPLPEPAAYIEAPETVDEEEDPKYDRRNLLRQGIHFFAKPAIESVQNKVNKVNDAVDRITKRVPLIRPPGAISEQAFLKACTRCDDCANACPKDAIMKVPKTLGFLIMGTPYIDPKKVPCVMCDDLPCISACQEQALKPVTSKFAVKMGHAILDKNKCQAYGDTFCQQCVIDCPIPGAIEQVNGKPKIIRKNCTGCGVCVLSCSTVNIPVAIKIKPQMVTESQIRKKQLEEARERIRVQQAEEKRKAEEEEAAQELNSGLADIADAQVAQNPDEKPLE